MFKHTTTNIVRYVFLGNKKTFLIQQENDLTQADKYAEVAMSADRYNPAGENIEIFHVHQVLIATPILKITVRSNKALE